MVERVRFVLEQRGYDTRNVRAVTHSEITELSPLTAKRKLEVLPEFTETEEFKQLASLFKRVKNIAKNLEASAPDLGGKLTEPAEKALAAGSGSAAAGDRGRGGVRHRLSAGVCRGGEGRAGGREIFRRCDGDG